MALIRTRRRRALAALLATALAAPAVAAHPAGLQDAPLQDAPRIDPPDGDAPDGDAPDGDAPNGDAPNGDAPNGVAPQGDERPGAHADRPSREAPSQDAAGAAARSGDFDADAWARRLTAGDLVARERAYDELAALASRRPRVRAWIGEQARVGRGELAWTCRLLERSLVARDELTRLERVLDDRRGDGPRGAQALAWTDFLADAEAAPLVVQLGLPERGGLAREGGPEGQGGDAHLEGRWRIEHHRFVLGGGADEATVDLFVEAFVPQVPWARRLDIALSAPTAPGARPLVVERHLGGGADGLVPARPSGLRGSGAPLEGPGAPLEGPGAGATVEGRIQVSGTVGADARLVAAPSFERLGVRVRVPVEPNARSNASAAGIAVLDVETGSIAHALGIAGGDQLLSIDGRRLVSADDISTQIERAARRGHVRVAWFSAAAGEVFERGYVALAPGVAAPGVPATGDAPPTASNGDGAPAPIPDDGKAQSGDAQNGDARKGDASGGE